MSVASVLTLVLSTSQPSSAAGGGPRCFGKPATIVGTNDRDRIEATNGPDVIVALDPAAGRIVARPLRYYGE